MHHIIIASSHALITIIPNCVTQRAYHRLLMSTTLEITGYGEPAHAALANTVERYKREDPLSPVSVIVWSNYMGIAARRALGQRRGVAAVNFLTPYRLAELLGSTAVAATGKRPISTPVLAAAVRAVLSDEPGRFEGVHTHPATERSLVKAHRTLSAVPDHKLDDLAQRTSLTDEVVRVYRAVNRETAHHYYNERDIIEAAVEAAAQGSAGLVELGAPILFLPQRLKADHARLLTALGRHTELHVIAGATGCTEADEPVRLAVEQLGAKWSPPSATLSVADRALSVSDADEEVRHALRSIVAASLEGIPHNRCAVLYGSHDPYSRILGDAFDAAGIEWFGQTVRTTESSLMGRALFDMLSLGDHDYSRENVFAWLAGAPVQQPDRRRIPLMEWERASRAAGVVSGPGQWQDRLIRWAQDRKSEAEQFSGDEDQQWRIDRMHREADSATELAEFVASLVGDLRRGHGLETWSELAKWCRSLIGAYLGSESRRESWPAHEKRAAERIATAIDRIGDLDGIDPHPGVAAFRRALESQIADDLGLHGKFGHGVLVGPVDLAVGLELDHVVVLGLADGTMPARRRDDPLVPDHARQAAELDLPTRADQIRDTHRALLSVMAASGHTLFMFPRGDLRKNAQRTPSRWLLDTCEARDGVRPTAEDLSRETGDWLVEVPSFVAGLRAADFPAHEQEYDMRALLDWRDRHGSVSKAPQLKQRQALGRGVRLIEGRYSNRFTRFDGNLCEGISADARKRLDPTEGVTSTTRLEAWAKCPHAYFLRHVLGINPVEDPDEQYRISSLTTGHLVHTVIDRWIIEARRNGSIPRPMQPWTSDAVERLVEIGEEEAAGFERRGLVGRGVYWQRDKRVFLNDLREFARFDSKQREEHNATPFASELTFGMPDGRSKAIELPLPGGRSIKLRGAIDRVDQVIGGDLSIIDYKSGSTSAFKNLEEDPFVNGTRLQLLLYSLAARRLLGLPEASVFAAYWFVTRKGGFKQHGYRITPELEEAGLKTVADIVEGIGSGLFPAHPADPKFRLWVDCDYCEPDGLGLNHQHRDWQRKQGDPFLSPYLEVNGGDNG